MSKDFLKDTIVKHLAGSQAYGTSTPTSDTDYRGIFVADKEYIISPFISVGEATDTSEEDTKFYELNKYMKLYMDGNPNVLESLWVEPSDIVQSTEMYDYLRSNAQSLLSTKIAYTYSGYAYNQAHRMQNHHSWMDKERHAETRLTEIFEMYPCQQTINWMEDNFPDYIVQRIDTKAGKNIFIKTFIDFERFMRYTSLQLVSSKPLKQYHFVKLVHSYLPEKLLDRDFNIRNFNDGYKLVPYGDDIYGVIRSDSRTLNDDGSLFISDEDRDLDEIKTAPALVVKMNRKEYKENSENRKSYHKWKENRNDTRKVLESAHGYDTKHAMHVVRLLRTAEEALLTGEVHVKRPDAEELLAIRNGAWSYDELMEYFNSKSTEIRDVLVKKSVLPKKPDIKLATKVLVDLREMQWYGKKWN